MTDVSTTCRSFRAAAVFLAACEKDGVDAKETGAWRDAIDWLVDVAREMAGHSDADVAKLLGLDGDDW